MAVRGKRPKPVSLRVITGTFKGPLPPPITICPLSDNGLIPPKILKRREAELWDAFIKPLYWLSPVDAPRAFMWVCLHAQFERGPSRMLAGKISQLRSLGSELGLDPSSPNFLLGKTIRG